MLRFVGVCAVLVAFQTVSISNAAEGDQVAKAIGIAERTKWQNTKLVGSPEPPLPYTTEPVFTEIDWDRPLYAKSEPGTGNLLVILQGGEADRPARIVRLDTANPTSTESLLELDGRLAYGLAFDPNYETNGLFYVFSNGPTVEPERTNRISRFQVSDPPSGVCDPSSELVIIEWRSMGHDGGEMGFGADGMLYISSGDGTSDSDGWLSGQDVSNLLGGVLRIDVRGATTAEPYKVPPDNPFVGMEGARGELWAFGLRNPWRIWCDQRSGQIWVGNNGQDLWESVHLIRRGENYGWSVYEGSHPFYPQRQRGPAEIVPPTIEHHHTEARSLTGGVVYRGEKHPELDGAYVYGDYSTGKIWGVRHDGTKVTWHQELADTPLQIAGFAIDPSDELLMVDHGGSLHRLKQREATPTTTDFPQRLSETDLFASVEDHVLNPGIIPYSVNAPGWNDGAQAERFFAIPGDEKIVVNGNRGWDLPDGSVVAQTLSLDLDGATRRVETRLLVRQQGEWAGYTYHWNDDQTDANLVSKTGRDLELRSLADEPTPWHLPSRAECMSCHSRAVNFVLGLSNAQMNRQHDDGGITANQIDTLAHIGLFEKAPATSGPALTNPYDATQPLASRARSYLHVNCSSCHVEAGGGNARMELEFTKELDDMRLVSARPQHTSFEISNAMLVAPGDPDRSVLVKRISRRGAGQMPPLFTRTIDEQGVHLMEDWIASLPKNERKFVRGWTTDELAGRIESVVEERSTENGKKVYQELGCIQCHRIADEGGGAGPDLTRIATKLTPAQIVQSIVEPSATIAPEYTLTMLTTTDGRVVTGRIEFENEDVIRLRSPQSFDVPITIPTAEIDARALSKVSMMPAEMLNTCSEEEIFDLVSYLLSVSKNANVDTSSP